MTVLLSPSAKEAMKGFCDQYHPDLDVTKNYTPRGVRFFDIAGTSVSILTAERREKMLYTDPPYTDVTVFESRGIILGWIQSEKMISADDIYLTPENAIEAMPSSFKFAVTCPHLSKYGGWLDQDQDYWTCFNCGKSIVFADHR